MTIENRLAASKARFYFILYSGTTLVTLGYSFLSNLFTTSYISDEHYIIWGLGIFCIFAYLYNLILQPNYIWFSDDKGKIVLRYYFPHPFLKNLRAIEIPLSSFTKFEIKTSLFGLKKWLILYQRTPKGTAIYPAVCLSALSKNEMRILTNTLRSHQN